MAGSVKKNNLSEPKKVSKPEEKKVEQTKAVSAGKKIQFRIMVGSYEHNLLCLSLILDSSNEKQPIFQPIFHFQAHSLSIKSIDLAKRYLVTGSNDEHIRIYDLQKRKELGALLSHQGTITTLKFSQEGAAEASENSDKSGKWLLSGSEDGKIIIWRTKDWETFGILKGHQGKVNDLAIHPTGRVAISVSEDKTIRLWNLMTAKKAAVLKIKGRDHLGQCGEFVRWSTDGKYFVVGMLNQMLVYETSSAKIIRKIKFNSTLMCMDILNIEGKNTLITGHGNGCIDFYDFDEKVLPFKESDSEQSVWDATADTMEPDFVLRGHTNRIKDVTVIKNPETLDTPYLISVSSDGKIVVWNILSNVRDQVAVYDSGERLNCVVACPESVEKFNTMKRRFNEIDEINKDALSESEYETDGEEIKKVLLKKRKGKKNKKNTKVSVTLE